MLDNVAKLEKEIRSLRDKYGENYLNDELIRYFQNKLIYLSSLAENEIITEARVEEITKDYPSFIKKKIRTKAEMQAAGQKDALVYTENVVRKKEGFDSITIKEIHRLVLERGWPDVAGKYRNENLELKGTSLMPTHFSKIPEEMYFLDKFIEEMLTKKLTIEEIIEFSSTVHHRITSIHPFRDGNGRVARIAANLVLRYYNFPYILIPKVRTKENMRKALRTADAGDLTMLRELNSDLLSDSVKIIKEYYNKQRALKNHDW